ncbi:hypothetical protein [Microcoleus anatoxicus]|uniref:Uncharacterized protein n=1 Tax=Microcoleus anatoxicus PTRS2 TaxID=2705321 RepID=A0ABU8YLC2_9CYAN
MTHALGIQGVAIVVPYIKQQHQHNSKTEKISPKVSFSKFLGFWEF